MSDAIRSANRRLSEQDALSLADILAPPQADEEAEISDITDTRAFNVTIGGLIVINAAQMGLEHVVGSSAAFVRLEHFFTAVFLAEAALKVYYKRVAYFKDVWNLVDIVVVLVAVLDNWILSWLLPAGELNLPAVSILRLVRLTRLLRMFKMLKMRKDMRVLLEGMTAAFRSMVPVGLLLSVAIYAMTLVCLDSIEPDYESLASQFEEVEQNWSTFGRSILTVFNVVILGEWDQIVWPLWDRFPGLVVGLCIFVFLTSFGLLNVIIGLISESVTESAHKFDHEQNDARRTKQLNCVRALAGMVEEMDSNGDGVITEDELVSGIGIISDPSFGFPLGFQPEELMMMLDFDGDKQVTHMEFITTLMRLVLCDEFQHRCLMTLHLNMIKEEIHAGLSRSVSEVKAAVVELKESLDSMKASVGLRVPESPQRDEPGGRPQLDAGLHGDPAGTEPKLIPHMSMFRDEHADFSEQSKTPTASLVPLLRANELSAQALLAALSCYDAPEEPQVPRSFAPRSPLRTLLPKEGGATTICSHAAGARVSFVPPRPRGGANSLVSRLANTSGAAGARMSSAPLPL